MTVEPRDGLEFYWTCDRWVLTRPCEDAEERPGSWHARRSTGVRELGIFDAEMLASETAQPIAPDLAARLAEAQAELDAVNANWAAAIELECDLRARLAETEATLEQERKNHIAACARLATVEAERDRLAEAVQNTVPMEWYERQGAGLAAAQREAGALRAGLEMLRCLCKPGDVDWLICRRCHTLGARERPYEQTPRAALSAPSPAPASARVGGETMKQASCPQCKEEPHRCRCHIVCPPCAGRTTGLWTKEGDTFVCRACGERRSRDFMMGNTNG